jgi:predicted kinase
VVAEAEDHLRNGRGVIVDATFRRRDDRLAAMTVANRCGVPMLFIECQANHAEVLSRLSERSRTGDDPSDATQEVYLRQRSEFAPLREFPARHHLVVDTTAGIDHALNGIEYALTHLS